MPTPAELAHWFSGRRLPKVDADPVLAHLHRTTAARPAWPELHVMAFDHRSQFEAMAREAGAPPARIPMLKKLLLRAAEATAQRHGLAGRLGVLIDGRYGSDALCAATGRGWWVGRPVESPGSRPLAFDGTRSIGSALVTWPREQVVKCLVHYHPDDAAELRVAQEERLLELWEATRASGHELLLEVIAPDGNADEAVLRTVKRFYNLGLKPEWWKLAPMATASWDSLAALVAERDPQCRGAVVLGLNQPLDALVQGFAQATHPIVKGFMVGRTIWADASRAWLAGEIDDDALVERSAERFAASSKPGAHARNANEREDDPPDDGAGAGAATWPRCASSTTTARKRRTAPACGRSSATATWRASAKRWPAARPAADLPRAQRAGDGACGDRLREGAFPPAHDGRARLRSVPVRPTWSPPRRWRMSTGCRCCCCPATCSPSRRPTRCCSRSRTSTPATSAPMTPSGRCRAISTASRDPSRSSARCPAPCRC